MTPQPEVMPGFWRNETSGVLAPAIKAYLRGDVLTEPQVSAIRAYLRQWVMSPVWDANPHHDDASRQRLATLRALVDYILSQAAVRKWLALALDAGIDPL